MEPACYAALTLVLSKWYLIVQSTGLLRTPEDFYWNASCVCLRGTRKQEVERKIPLL